MRTLRYTTYGYLLRLSQSLLLVLSLCTCVCAQNGLNLGEAYSFYSETLEEERLLNVLFPSEYQDSTTKNYPVVYLLDGGTDEDFFHVAGMIRYFEAHKMMPPVILVGVANVDRKRDFTYPSTDPRDLRDFPTSGGSAKFIGFLQDELLQWVDERFRTLEHRTLIGQSLGGLLATEVLFEYAGHFQDFIIVSPSLWWDERRLMQRFQALHDELQKVPERLFVAVGEEYPVMVTGARQLASVFWEEGAETQASFRYLSEEDHNTILHEALYQALDEFYDKPVERRYRFANRWEGLGLRSSPSADAPVMATLAYGQELGLLKAPPATERETDEFAEMGIPGKVDGYEGHWRYVGSDLGTGWVFDAYLSPLPVFKPEITLSGYAYLELNYASSVMHETPETGDAWVRYSVSQDAKGNQFILHDMHVDWAEELRIAHVSAAQAEVLSRNFLLAKGYSDMDVAVLLEEDRITLSEPQGGAAIDKQLFFKYLEEEQALSVYLLYTKQK